MPDVLTPDPALGDTGEATPASTPTPLYRMSQDAVGGGGLPSWMAPVDTSALNRGLDAYLEKGREQSAAIGRAAERGSARLDEDERVAASQADERKAAMPGALALPNAPSMKARGFGDPGPDASILHQLQSVMLGIGVIAQQWAGLRGSSTAAVSALRGAFQGWADGDHERANREMKKWQADTEKLLAEHKDRVESYQRIWDDQKLSWAQRMDLTSARARLDGLEPLMLATEKQDIGQIIDVTAKQMQWNQQHQDRVAAVVSQIQARTDARHDAQQFKTEMDASNKKHQVEIELMREKARSLDAADRREDAERVRKEIQDRDFAFRREMEDKRIAAAKDAKEQTLDLQLVRGGPWLDKGQPGLQQVNNLTRGDWNAAGGDKAYARVQPQQLQVAQLLVSQGFPAIDRMVELAPKVLAKGKGSNLIQWVDNKFQTKLSDADVREFAQTATTVAYEYSRAVGGSSALRKFVADMIRETEVPNLGDRVTTANRMLENTRNVMMNYIREIKGLTPMPYPGSPRTIDAWDKSGQKVQMKLAPFERLPAGFEYY